MAQRDYHHDVHQIRTALHSTTGSRASVMVGSGFSLNARKRYASAREFPVWNRLTESLVQRLYPDDETAQESALKNAGATSGALRLAQEFEAAFGRTVLLNHLRDMIPDREHEPSMLHGDLLGLPWTDVFTTNYDTLLERAALPLRERRYEIVRCVNDLPLKCSPRIVKLHGTLPELNDCIITEEDFRTYPDAFSPFVAEVQVAMVESHLCLIGFSGDDPNFLAWSGWVRDRLGKQTLPIYLWTFYEPTSFQVRMLEQRSVIPLPLSTITGKSDCEEALKCFLELLKRPLEKQSPRWCMPRHLKSEKPIKEPIFPRDSKEKASIQKWSNAAIIWRANRKLNPGWMIPHIKAIEDLWDATDEWAQAISRNSALLCEQSPATQIFILFELVWRMRYCLFPIYDDLALSCLMQSVSGYENWRKNCEDSKVIVGAEEDKVELDVVELDSHMVEILLESLRHAREIGNFDRFEEVLEKIENILISDTFRIDREKRERIKHFSTYEIALKYLSTWEDEKLGELLSNWDTSLVPMWALRRAGVLLEVGRRKESEVILEDALGILRTMADEGTPETWSIEAWVIHALRLIKKSEEWPFNEIDQEPQSQSQVTEKVLHNVSVVDQPIPESHKRTKLPPVEGQDPEREKRIIDFDDTLSWLRDRNCDPIEILEWCETENYIRKPVAANVSRKHSFDSRRWTTNRSLGDFERSRQSIAAYRTMRLIEDAGLPLRLGIVRFPAGSLAEIAVNHLSSCNALEATEIVLRIRSKKLIEEWYTRSRIAVMPTAEIARQFAFAEACVQRLANDEATRKHTGDERRQFEAAIELLSRLAVRQKDEILQQLLRYAITISMKVRIWSSWWLADDIACLVRRVCSALSTKSFVGMSAELLDSPVPGSHSFPSLQSRVHWLDPIELLAHRKDVELESPPKAIEEQVDSVCARVMAIPVGEDSRSERKCLLLRLMALNHLGLLNAKQKEQFAKALYIQRDPYGFPDETGCLDSVVLSVPVPDGVKELQIFRKKYVETPWPSEFQDLYSLLQSLARTGPIIGTGPGQRLREINWSNKSLLAIASRCCQELEHQAEIRQAELSREKLGGFREMFSINSQPMILSNELANVIEDVLLRQKSVSDKILNLITAAVKCALHVDLPVLSILPKLASFVPYLTDELGEKVILRISSGDSDTLFDGLSTLNHWANQLSDSRIPQIPKSPILVLAGRLNGAYFKDLIHILDTVRNLFSRLPFSQAKELFNLCESALIKWTRHFDYKWINSNQVFEEEFRSELPDLRASMTRLCLEARQKGIDSLVVDEWLELVSHDRMPEIQNSLLDPEE